MADKKPVAHLTSPIISGSTVIGIKFNRGVIIATDTLLSYGGLLSISSLTQNTRTSKGSPRSRTT